MPFTPEPLLRRTMAARKAVYAHQTSLAEPVEQDEMPHHITDLMTNLLHLARLSEIDTERLLARVTDHFACEIGEETEDQNR